MSKNIFCNSCFEDKEDSSRIFFCTSCSHIFCSTCLNNYESFCLICKVKCKVLEINEDLPADVKLIFDETCFEKCIENAARAFSFQENQARFYTHSLKVRVCKYQRIKKDLLKFKQLSIDITKTIRKEKALMEKLKFAYRLVLFLIFNMIIDNPALILQIRTNNTRFIHWISKYIRIYSK